MRKSNFHFASLCLFLLLCFTFTYTQAQLSVTMTTTPACSLDGSATAIVTGGLPPYTYQWNSTQGAVTNTSNTLTGLSGGWVYLYVTDASQNWGWAQATVARPFQIAVSATDETCSNGAGTATATVTTGGTPPFTYAWSNGMTGSSITGLGQGGYWVTVTDANGCFVVTNNDSSLTAWVGNATPMSGTLVTTPSTCTDGTLSMTNITGGTPPYAYVWGTTPVQTTPVATNVPGNSWGTVTVTDAVGCHYVDYFYVNQLPNGLSLSVNHTNETCIQSNGSASVFVNGGTAPYTYLWSNGATSQFITGLPYGSYLVTVTDANNCPKIGSVYIDRTDPLTLSFSPTSPSCLNAGGALTINVNGGAAPYSYLWNNGATTASISGLSAGYYSVTVTDANGCYDHAWIHLEMPLSCYGTIAGSVVGDANNNCVSDIADFPFHSHWVEIGGNYAYTSSNGDYVVDFLPGTYLVSQPYVQPNFAQSCPSGPPTYTVNLSPQQVVGNQDFFNVVTNSVNDLSVTMYAEPARPTAPQHVYVYYRNDGTTFQNATINYVHDALMTLNNGGWQMTSYNSGTRTLSYNLGVLAPLQTGSFIIEFSIPTTATIGTPYTQYVEILPTSNDATPANNQVTDPGLVVTAYDPNAKSVYPDGQITTSDSVLTYIVQFQNTGNDTAFTVAIRDEIDPDLHLTTMEILGASHAYTVDAEAPNVVNFRFANIMLPDSNINEPLSHGHIIYRIHLKPNLPTNAQINNTAAIYFDYNPPILTNTTLNYFGVLGKEEALVQAGFMLYPNPARGLVSLRLDDSWVGNTQVQVLDLSGKLLTEMALNPTESRDAQLNLQGLSAGVYMVACVADGQRVVRKLMLQ